MNRTKTAREKPEKKLENEMKQGMKKNIVEEDTVERMPFYSTHMTSPVKNIIKSAYLIVILLQHVINISPFPVISNQHYPASLILFPPN